MTRLPNLRDQLVDAARRQDAPRRFLAWRPFLVGSIAAVGLSGAALAATGTPVPGLSGGSPTGPEPRNQEAARRVSLDNQVTALINRANEETWKVMPRCRPTARAPAPGRTARALASGIPREARELVAAFRRPATKEERTLDRGRTFRGLGGTPYVDSLRVVRIGKGERFVVAALQTRGGEIFRPKPGCLDAQRDRLGTLVSGSPPRLRSLALEQFSYFRVGQERNLRTSTKARTSIALIGSGGGPVELRGFRRSGTFTAGQRANEPVRVVGLVPDGVRTIEVSYPKRVSRGRDFKPVVYPSAIEITEEIRNNVVSFTVARPAPDALPTRMTWRDAKGRVVRVIDDTP